MRLTRHTDYALRVLLQAAGTQERLSIAGVAATHRISRNHAMKVVNLLARHGLLKTMRGRGGGFTLGRPADVISLGEVVRLTEPELQAADCGACVLREGCGLTSVLGRAMVAFLTVLDATTLADAAAASRWAGMAAIRPDAQGAG